jgi:hypothetical protein
VPPPERASLKQKAVYWAVSGRDAYNEPTLAPPVEIPVRWETQRGETTDASGNEIATDATAYLMQRVTLGSNLWLGTLAEWSATGSGGQDTELMEVVSYSETPDIKGRVASRSVQLRRFRNANPT